MREHRESAAAPCITRTITRIVGSILAVCSLLIFLQFRTGWPLRQKVVIPAAAMEATGGRAYGAAGKMVRLLRSPMHSTAHVRENGVALPDRVVSSARVRASERGAFCFGARQVWFSSTDGTDPRVNGRVYEAVFPLVVPTWMVRGGLALALVSLLFFCRAESGVWPWRLVANWSKSRIQRWQREKEWKTDVERLLTALVVVVFFVPLALHAFFLFWTSPIPRTAWLRNETLVGLRSGQTAASFSWKRVRSGDYQKDLAEQFNGGFHGRELLIRATCEMWYRMFRRPGPGDLKVTLGRDDFIYQDSYLKEYCRQRPSKAQLEPFVRDLRRLQDACDRAGIAFVFLLTPSKAAILPDHIPSAWMKLSDPRPRAYDHLVPLIKESGVRFVDGHALTVQSMAAAPAPVFPKGGIHLGSHGVWVITNAVIAALQAQGKPARLIEHERLWVSMTPEGTDADLMELMNLIVPWRYPVTRMEMKPPREESSPGLNCTIIGGSFAEQVWSQMGGSGQFSRIDNFFYYTEGKFSRLGRDHRTVRTDVGDVDFDREIFSADCMVLESNEQALDMTGPDHLKKFLADALRHLENAPPVRSPALHGNPDRTR